MPLPREERELITAMREPTTFRRRALNGYMLVEATGAIDLAAAPMLRDELSGAMEAGSTQIVIDLAKVTLLDSSGISVLLEALRRATNEGGWLRLARVSDGLRKMLHVSGVEELLPNYQTLENAASGVR